MQLCPNCRQICTSRELQRLPQGSLLHRIWSGIAVICPHHEQGCAWTGSVADAVHHIEICDKDKEGIDRLQKRVLELQEKLNEKDELLTKLDVVHQRLRRDPRLRFPVLFNGEYDFNRESVVKLSQLISRYLENKPSQIDANKIYNCIRNCYVDFQKDYEDNPENYYDNMRMLLTTCAASRSWFTNKQMNNILSWLSEEQWM